ncbi:MAG: alpha/beta hydrolase [Armatimonadetes bacterium]|nr:alpha/beta hydrolase [Armatimonadota bacterium]
MTPMALALAVLCTLAGDPAPKPPPQPVGEPHVYKTVGGRDLSLWVNLPPGWQAADTRPCLVLFHGGGWVNGDPSSLNRQATYLAGRGMVTVLVQYRLLKAKEDPTKCINDARSALRWVRSHAAELGVDPKRIGAGGGSAGGHLAAHCGMVAGVDDPTDDLAVSPRPDALVLYNPVIDNGPGGWGAARVGDRYPEFSPRHNLSADDPPTVIFLGTKDDLVPVKTIEDMAAELARLGVRCETHFYEGAAHGFYHQPRYQTLTLIGSDRFLASLGWLSGEPTLAEPAR